MQKRSALQCRTFESELAILLNIIKAVSTSPSHKAISDVTKIGTIYLIIFDSVCHFCYGCKVYPLFLRGKTSYRGNSGVILRNFGFYNFRHSVLTAGEIRLYPRSIGDTANFRRERIDWSSRSIRAVGPRRRRRSGHCNPLKRHGKISIPTNPTFTAKARSMMDLSPTEVQREIDHLLRAKVFERGQKPPS